MTGLRFAAAVCMTLLVAATPIGAEAQSQGNTVSPALAAAVAQVRANPSDAEASFRLARIASESGDYRTAIAALERILLQYPSLANIKLELGVLYLRTGQTVLAERFISQALESPDAPPQVRARAEDLLAAAAEGNKRLRFAGTASAGLISESNANFGAEDGTLVGNLPIDATSAGRSGNSAYLTLSGQWRYDLGLQDGHLLAFDASFYGRVYDPQSELNLARVALAPGIDINLARSFGRPADLILRYEFSDLSRGGDRYLRENGINATLRVATGDRGRLQVQTFWVDQDFIPTSDITANNDRDGDRAGIGIGYTAILTDSTSAFVGVDYTSKSARQQFEAYEDLSLVLGYSKGFKAPIGKKGPWRLDLSLRASTRRYDGPDPFLARPDPSVRQRDERLNATIDLTVPVSDKAALLFEAGYTTQSSTYAIKEYDNTYVSIGVTQRF